jgi:hypothetical protein
MNYHVTFQLAGEERTESVDAPDAATAVSKIQFDFGRTDEMFELISVQVDESSAEDDDAASASVTDKANGR